MAEILTDASFNDFIQSSPKVFVDFYADWCGPCKMMTPIVEELSKEHSGKVKIAKINISDHPNTASTYNVQSIPTFMLFKDGKPVKTVLGAVPKEQLVQMIENN